VLEALRAGRRVRRVLLAAGAHGAPLDAIVDEATRRGIPVLTVDRERLDAVDPHHQGVAAEAAPFAYLALSDLLRRLPNAASPPIVLALDALQDPQNFGTLLRTAAAVGVSGVVIPQRRAVGVTPAVGRAAAGATEHLAVARVGNLVRALADLKTAGLWVLGLDPHAPRRFDEADLSVPLVLVVGSEGKGLSRLVREACDLVLALPMAGATDSLNAAAAGSIVLYEAYRRRGFPTASTPPSPAPPEPSS